MVLDHLGVPTGDDAQIADPILDQPFDDVFQEGPTLDPEHGLGEFLGEFPHAGAFAGGEDDSFHKGVRTRAREG